MPKYIILTSGRTGSQVLIESLRNISSKIASEPLNQAYNEYEDFLPCKKEEVLNLHWRNKVRVVDKIMEKYDLCKILHYQLEQEGIHDLRKRYKFVALLRCPFEVFMSFKIAEMRGRWHNIGQDKETPEDSQIVSKQEMLNSVSYYINNYVRYDHIMDKTFYYEDIVNRWQNVIEDFATMLDNQKLLKSFKVLRKNPEDPEDYIQNYHELRKAYNEEFLRILTHKFV